MAVPAVARDHLESLLRARRLDRTLTTATPLWTADDQAFAQTGIPALDAQLGGGLVRGHLSEVAGSRSTGRMAIVVAVLAAATERGEAVALIDPLDEFDPGSAGATGLDLSRLLWVRGQAGGLGAPPGAARASITREWRDGTTGVERALKAMSLVLQAGNFGVVALDLADVPVAVLRRLPFTTWLRLQRGIDGSQTVGLLATPEPIARSTHGATIHLDRGQRTAASGQVPRRFPARTVAARAIQPRRMRTDGGLDLTMTAVLE